MSNLKTHYNTRVTRPTQLSNETHLDVLNILLYIRESRINQVDTDREKDNFNQRG